MPRLELDDVDWHVSRIPLGDLTDSPQRILRPVGQSVKPWRAGLTYTGPV
jgi:hypothetical protein